MANVGSAAAGKTLIGNGNGASPTFKDIGTNSGLSAHGVLLAQGNAAFTTSNPGTAGTLLVSNGVGSDPTFQSGGTYFGQTITGVTGGALHPTAGNWTLDGSGSITTAGSGSTLTTQLTGLTNHNVLVGSGTTTITKIAPSSTSGVALISQGASADPTFGIVVPAGGGTGQNTSASSGVAQVSSGTWSVSTALSNGTTATTQSAADNSTKVATTAYADTAATGKITGTTTQFDVIVGAGTNSVGSVGPGSAGQVLQSGGNAANPVYSTATYPATTTAKQILYSSATNTVSGLATANSSVLVTDGSGVPSLSTTLPSVSATAPFTVSGIGSGNAVLVTDTANTSGAIVALTGDGVTTPTKFLRSKAGNFEILNNAFNSVIFQVTDAGATYGTSWVGGAIGTQYGGTGQNFSASTGLISLSSGTASATQTPSVTSITLGGGTALANYVEGSWTPGISFGGGTTGITYTTQTGFYTRIGNLVFVRYYIVLSNKGSSTGLARITGLPVNRGTAGDIGGMIATIFSNITLTAGQVWIGGYADAATTVQLTESGSNTAFNFLTDTNFSNTSFIEGQFFYNA